MINFNVHYVYVIILTDEKMIREIKCPYLCEFRSLANTFL